MIDFHYHNFTQHHVLFSSIAYVRGPTEFFEGVLILLLPTVYRRNFVAGRSFRASLKFRIYAYGFEKVKKKPNGWKSGLINEYGCYQLGRR